MGRQEFEPGDSPKSLRKFGAEGTMATMSQPVHRNHSRAKLHKVIRVESFRAGCGEFIGMGDLEKEEVEKPGLAVLPEHIRYQEGMFAVRAKGTSMLPKILDGDFCFFIPDLGGTRLNRIVLVEHRFEGMDRDRKSTRLNSSHAN